MSEIIVRIRPRDTMDDLDVDLVQARAERLTDWKAEFHDTRLSDAPYVTFVLRIPEITAEAVAQLKTEFGDLPRMRARLYTETGNEIPLATAELEGVKRADRQDK